MAAPGRVLEAVEPATRHELSKDALPIRPPALFPIGMIDPNPKQLCVGGLQSHALGLGGGVHDRMTDLRPLIVILFGNDDDTFGIEGGGEDVPPEDRCVGGGSCGYCRFRAHHQRDRGSGIVPGCTFGNQIAEVVIRTFLFYLLFLLHHRIIGCHVSFVVGYGVAPSHVRVLLLLLPGVLHGGLLTIKKPGRHGHRHDEGEKRPASLKGQEQCMWCVGGGSLASSCL